MSAAPAAPASTKRPATMSKATRSNPLFILASFGLEVDTASFPPLFRPLPTLFPPPKSSFSVREWIELPVRLDELPPVREPVRLEYEEQHDDEPEDPLLERDRELGEAGEVRGDRCRHGRKKLRQEHHEDGPEDGAYDASQ